MLNRELYKNMLKSMGLQPFAYWLGNFLIDCLLLLPTSLTFIAFQGSSDIFRNLMTQIILMTSLITMSYHFSCWFSNFAIYQLIYSFSSWIVYILILHYEFDKHPIWGTVVLFFLPYCSLCSSLLLSVGFLVPAFGILFQFILLMNKDPHTSTQTFAWKHMFKSHQRTENPDTSQEKSRLLNPDNKDAVRIIQGYKFYPDDWQALQDLNFGMEKGQIFCLLGPNEAGKTTTFDIITGKTRLTYGKAYIYGQELGKSTNAYTIGCCSQIDTLWENFTVEQHMRLFACLKGINEDDIDENIDRFTGALGLKQHLEKPVKALSGGTKRKLSVALALIGGPDLIVLDEPTTGVDPIGRNQIWTLLKTLAEKKKSTILISTHYMEDAELVADKLGILVNGSMKSLGNIADIRRTYQEHYLTAEGVSNGFEDILASTIKRVLPEAVLDTNSDDKKMIFKVSSEAMKFSEVCFQLENFVADKKIAEFSINVSTLEEAFLEYAKQQKNKPLKSVSNEFIDYYI